MKSNLPQLRPRVERSSTHKFPRRNSQICFRKSAKRTPKCSPGKRPKHVNCRPSINHPFCVEHPFGDRRADIERSFPFQHITHSLVVGQIYGLDSSERRGLAEGSLPVHLRPRFICATAHPHRRLINFCAVG